MWIPTHGRDHGKRPLRQHVAHRIGKLQKTKAVSHVATALSDNLTQIILSVAMFSDQLLVTQRFFERVQVGALNVFDDCKLKRGPIIDITNDNGNFGETGKLSCAPATFTGNDFKTVLIDSPNDDRLDDTNADGSTRQGPAIRSHRNDAARVAWATRDKFDRNRAVRV